MFLGVVVGCECSVMCASVCDVICGGGDMFDVVWCGCVVCVMWYGGLVCEVVCVT